MITADYDCPRTRPATLEEWDISVETDGDGKYSISRLVWDEDLQADVLESDLFDVVFDTARAAIEFAEEYAEFLSLNERSSWNAA